MVDDEQIKSQMQRKRRLDRETCINNVKLNLSIRNSAPVYSNSNSNNHHHQQHPHNKVPSSSHYYQPSSKCSLHPGGNSNNNQRRHHPQRGSLENVSGKPWGEYHHHSTTTSIQQQSSLRRSRSLALTPRENFYDNLEKQRFYHNHCHQHPNPPPKQDTKSITRRSQLIPRAKLIDKPNNGNLSQDTHQLNGTRIGAEPLPIVSRKSEDYKSIYQDHIKYNNETDSVDSNYYSKVTYNHETYEQVPELSLPNYYPDTKYDTDNTDNVSYITETGVINTNNNNHHSNKENPITNATVAKVTNNTHDFHSSISYDENIILSTNRPLYDVIKDTKKRTIRNHTPYESLTTLHTTNKSETEKHYIEETESGKSIRESYENDKSFDEIRLHNENINAVDEQTTVVNSDYCNIEANPLYEQISNSCEYAEANPLIDEDHSKILSEYQNKNSYDVKSIEVEACVQSNEKFEDHRTVLHIEDIKSVDEDDHDPSKQHSHNYFKEFLETQKGSKKPLQNFITKKLSNLTRKPTKALNTNLIDNQFHSLPDITATKNLRKCEKIDQKLRKCEKTDHSRFIVNIGKEFGIAPAIADKQGSYPVDFEVKISKVKKLNEKKSLETQLSVPFRSLDSNHLYGRISRSVDKLHKPEIVGMQPKVPNLSSENSNRVVNNMNSTLSAPSTSSSPTQSVSDSECQKEYQEKLDSMRTYWSKLANPTLADSSDKSEEQTVQPTNKFVTVQSKVEDVKKRFEHIDREEEVEKPNKVQIAKQMFEPKIDKIERISPVIKETCNYFENTHFKDSTPLESLSPSIVEIVEQKKDESDQNTKDRKPVVKMKNNSNPEFDHVRYKVLKADLFQKNILAKCEKESQFDGLLEYLQNYSFQELLIDNNIVIVEPIRTKIPYENLNRTTSKMYQGTVNTFAKKPYNTARCSSSSLQRHFFYHPIRVNKEVNDEELPNPDTVKQVRQFFEHGLTRSQSSQLVHQKSTALVNGTNNRNTKTNAKTVPQQENDHSSVEVPSNDCWSNNYVRDEILEKIRERSTSTTYYGGQIHRKQETLQPLLTDSIMKEIKYNEKRNNPICLCQHQTKSTTTTTNTKNDVYQGVKFKLIKSNSCSSRLELVGTNNVKSIQKYLDTHMERVHMETANSKNTPQQQRNNETTEIKQKNSINLTNHNNLDGSKMGNGVVNPMRTESNASGRKMIQWAQVKRENCFNGIQYKEKTPTKRINYDYHNYSTLNNKTNGIDDMEFEPYEVATYH